MFVFVKIWDCHENRLRAGLAVCMPLTEASTRTSLTGRCGRIVTVSDENREHPAFVRRTNSRTKAERLRAVRVRPVPFGFRQAAPGFRRFLPEKVAGGGARREGWQEGL